MRRGSRTILLLVLAWGCGGGSTTREAPPRIVLIGSGSATSGRGFISDDLGASWESVVNPATNEESGPLRPIFDFVSREVGFSVASDGTLRSADGGRSWEHRPGSFPLPEGSMVADLAFVDEMRGIATATTVQMLSPQLSESFGEFLFTTDAGESWSRAQTAPERVLGSPHSLCTTPAGLGVALGTEIVSRVPRPALLMASRDGGRTWQSILGAYPGSASPRQMACQGQATIWVAGVTELFRSEDGGVSWDDRAGNFPPDALGRSIENLSFVSPANGALLAGSYLDPGQRLLVTTDGGDHWESLSVPGPLVEALLVSDGVVLAHATGDGSALFLSRDGGSTWQSIGLPPMVDSVDEIQIAAHR